MTNSMKIDINLKVGMKYLFACMHCCNKSIVFDIFVEMKGSNECLFLMKQNNSIKSVFKLVVTYGQGGNSTRYN